ncbi:MAG: hypothetical protein Rubg2KO_05500 [Rubricoccaceae bacterium]
MAGMIGGHKPRPRRFEYQPRFYDADAEERRKRQLKFVRPSERRAYKTRQPAFIAVGLGLVLVLYLYLNMGTIAERVAGFGGFFFG